MTIIALPVQGGAMLVSKHVTVTLYEDGVVNTMDRRWLDNDEYRGIAAHYGYDNWQQFNVDHDCAHHHVAYVLEQPYSYAIHDGDSQVPVGEAPPTILDEEVLVGALQRYMLRGVRDEWGLLDQTFGDRLNSVAMNLARICAMARVALASA